MMKAAEAINAMQSTLRPGRVAALRNPIRATGHAPCPQIVRSWHDRSDDDKRKRMAISSDVPAPKKPPTCPITFDAAATNNATPSAPKMITFVVPPLGGSFRKKNNRLKPELRTSSIDPDNRLRGDDSLNDLSVHQTQTSAVTIPDNAPISKDCDVTRNSSSVVPTAPTHQIGRASCRE